jgi:hypothetical protein
MRDHSRAAGAHSASTAQLIEETVWKLDAFDKQSKQAREKYYAYREWALRGGGVNLPHDVGGGGVPGEALVDIGSMATGSTNYDASRDPRLQR